MTVGVKRGVKRGRYTVELAGIIPSLEPFYHVFCQLCKDNGTWSGDIFALRKAFEGERLDGALVTKRLGSLQRRGMLTFTAEKVSHKRYWWTVMIREDCSR